MILKIHTVNHFLITKLLLDLTWICMLFKIGTRKWSWIWRQKFMNMNACRSSCLMKGTAQSWIILFQELQQEKLTVISHVFLLVSIQPAACKRQHTALENTQQAVNGFELWCSAIGTHLLVGIGVGLTSSSQSRCRKMPGPMLALQLQSVCLHFEADTGVGHISNIWTFFKWIVRKFTRLHLPKHKQPHLADDI